VVIVFGREPLRNWRNGVLEPYFGKLIQLQSVTKNWAVVGGGFLGMTLALRLAQQGKAVTLYEAAPNLGGLASAWHLGDIVWDRHYHVTLQSDSNLRSLLRELRLEQELKWSTTRTGFYTDSRFYSLSNTLEFIKFPPLNLVDKLRLGATIFYASKIKDWKSLEKTLVIDWLARWSGPRVVEKIWLPLLRAKLGENYRQTSAAFIWATIARMYAARRAGMKREVFGYVPGGYARTIDEFAKVLKDNNVSYRLGQPVRKIHSDAGSSVRVDLADGTSETFNDVVLTVAAPLAVRICPQLSGAEKKQLNLIQYQGIICASLLLKKPLSEFYITNITENWVPYTAVIEMSALVERSQFGGRTLVYLPKYVPSDSSEFKLDDDEIQDRFLGALERMYPKFHREDVLCFRISRVQHLLPISTLHYSDSLPSMSTSLPGVHIVNSVHIVNGTLNLNETVQLAESAAAKFRQSGQTENLSSELCEHETRETDRQPVIGC
jgi:protoporphyrinogen oxidase